MVQFCYNNNTGENNKQINKLYLFTLSSEKTLLKIDSTVDVKTSIELNLFKFACHTNYEHYEQSILLELKINISEPIAGRTMKLAHRPRIASTTINSFQNQFYCPFYKLC